MLVFGSQSELLDNALLILTQLAGSPLSKDKE